MLFPSILPVLLVSFGLIITSVPVSVARNLPKVTASQTVGGILPVQSATNPLLFPDLPRFTPQSQLAFQAKIDWDLDNVSHLFEANFPRTTSGLILMCHRTTQSRQVRAFRPAGGLESTLSTADFWLTYFWMQSYETDIISEATGTTRLGNKLE